MAYERLAIVNYLYTTKTEGYTQCVYMNNVKYSQTNSNFARAIYTNEIKKTIIQNTNQRKFKRFRSSNPKRTPQGFSYNTASKGNFPNKNLSTNLTQSIQANPLPSNDFYK